MYSDPLLIPAWLMNEASGDQSQKPVSREKISRTRALAVTESIAPLGAPLMKRWILVCLFMMIVFGSSVALTWADDLLPPPWQRGSDRTTYQDWTFATNGNPLGPDVGIINPYGIPTATISGGTWTQYFDNHVGVWSLGSDSFIDAPIPNAPDHPDWNKNLWIQLTWQPEQGTVPTILVDNLPVNLYETDQLPNTNWFHSTYSITLPYNPEKETVHLTGAVHLGEIVVDTQCVPEPSTMVMLAMGVLSLLAFGWRQRRQ
jgi:hypothetical protein